MRGHKESHIYARCKPPVHESHIKFVFKIRSAAQAPHDDLDVKVLGQPDHQPFKLDDLDVWQLLDSIIEKLDPLIGIEQKVF